MTLHGVYLPLRCSSKRLEQYPARSDCAIIPIEFVCTRGGLGGTTKALNTKFLYALAERLIQAAESEYGTITYGELGKHFQVSPRILANPLGQVSALTHELGYPLLSAVAVSQDTGLPGEGFYSFAAGLLDVDEPVASEWESFWDDVVCDVWDCGEWDSCLAELAVNLGLSLQTPSNGRRGGELKPNKTRVTLDTVEADIESELIEEGAGFTEGQAKQYHIKYYERDSRIRKAAIDKHGLKCAVCGFSFVDTYGELGSGFIEVHHVIPVSSYGGVEHEVDPETDVIPVCANCHRMIHRRHDDVLTVEKLRNIFETQKRAKEK